MCFSQQLKALGSQPVGSGVVRGSPRFHENSIRGKVPPGLRQVFTTAHRMLLEISPELIFLLATRTPLEQTTGKIMITKKHAARDRLIIYLDPTGAIHIKRKRENERERCQISCCTTCPLYMHDVHYSTAGLESTSKRVHAGKLHLCLRQHKQHLHL